MVSELGTEGVCLSACPSACLSVCLSVCRCARFCKLANEGHVCDAKVGNPQMASCLLYKWQPGWGLPSISPACIQVEVMSGKGVLDPVAC